MANSPAPNEHSNPGVTIRFGPADDGDVEMPDADADADGTAQGKRKSRSSGVTQSYVEQESSEEDDEPLVRHSPLPDVFP